MDESEKVQIDVCLKGLDISKDIKQEFLEEGNFAIAIYQITENPKDYNYVIVMEYAKQESLIKLLDSGMPGYHEDDGKLVCCSERGNPYRPTATTSNNIDDKLLKNKLIDAFNMCINMTNIYGLPSIEIRQIDILKKINTFNFTAHSSMNIEVT
ncbi:hypothetical protein C2G38_2191531 [Gigaspora rosea]|uniref:Protein kinase domain-containing protein n=1 Tax=Gigaspora rosea TaxID=44941 RepID=A0A397V015_9GLOM|nr:hypothetical protein C2G38_2191531 [Gigaspora rosea]